MLAPGDRAPAFELEDLNGAVSSASEAWSSQAVLLVFFKVACPTCQYTMPFVQRLLSGTASDAPAIVAVSQDAAPDTRQFQERFGLSIPTFLDPAPRYTASNLCRITHVPSFFFIEPGGRIALAFDGFEKHPLEQIAARFGAHLFGRCGNIPPSRPG
jgi:peroxiredoxin